MPAVAGFVSRSLPVLRCRLGLRRRRCREVRRRTLVDALVTRHKLLHDANLHTYPTDQRPNDSGLGSTQPEELQ